MIESIRINRRIAGVRLLTNERLAKGNHLFWQLHDLEKIKNENAANTAENIMQREEFPRDSGIYDRTMNFLAGQEEGQENFTHKDAALISKYTYPYGWEDWVKVDRRLDAMDVILHSDFDIAGLVYDKYGITETSILFAQILIQLEENRALDLVKSISRDELTIEKIYELSALYQIKLDNYTKVHRRVNK